MTMPRPTRNALLMDTAALWAKRSTCDRANVGAVFSRGGRILVTGYNGAPAGMPHCQHDFLEIRGDSGKVMSRVFTEPGGCTVAVHAEANGIAWAAREGVRLNGCEVHTTVAPCSGCSKLLLNAGIIRVMFGADHRDMDGVRLLEQAGIAVSRWADNGVS